MGRLNSDATAKRVRLKPDTTNVAVVSIAALLAWGAFAFGAVYPWAYEPLIAAATLAGALGILAGRRHSGGPSRGLLLALAAVAAAILLQLLPAPPSLVRALSPSTLDVVRQLDFPFGAGLVTTHPLSIQPAQTWTALLLLASFTLLLAGTARLLSRRGAEPLALSIALLGVLLALTGIVSKPLYNGKVYGFWTTEMSGSPFGPFVNKNHFAGWMLMGIPLALGVVCARISRGMRGVKPDFRHRALWLSSREASLLMLLGAGVAVMALSLVLTMSRSGMSAFALALAMTGWFVMSGRLRIGRKVTAIVYMAVVAWVVIFWVGSNTIVARFAEANWNELNGRRGAWLDAWRVATLFPLAGTGLNTYATAMRFFQRYDLDQLYAQAHNDYLQLAAEGGLLVSVPVIFCIFFFARDVRRRFREDGRSSAYWIRAGAVAGIVAIALQEIVEFSLQMPGNAALFAVMCGIAVHKAPERVAADVSPWVPGR